MSAIELLAISQVTLTIAIICIWHQLQTARRLAEYAAGLAEELFEEIYEP